MDRVYHYSVDIWALGCVFAEMMFGEILFTGKDNNAVMLSVLAVMGTEELDKYLVKYE